MPRTTIRTIAITVLINGTAVGTTTILSRQANTLGDVHERTYRLLPIVEYSCGGNLLAIEFTKLRHVNVSKISLIIIEYMAPVPSNDIRCFSNEGDDIYVELVNGSKKPMRKTLLYTVLIEHGGYIILEKDNRSIVKLVMVLNYLDGYTKQYGIEIVRVRVRQICLDSNCTAVFT